MCDNCNINDSETSYLLELTYSDYFQVNYFNMIKSTNKESATEESENDNS